MIKKLALCAFLFMSCVSPAVYKKEYAAFYEDAAKRFCIAPPIQVYFSRLESNIAGYCIYNFGILLNEDNWVKYGPYQRLELMYHELGHCALGLDHYEPGLMSPTIHKENEVRENWENWRDELFSNCSPTKLLEPAY